MYSGLSPADPTVVSGYLRNSIVMCYSIDTQILRCKHYYYTLLLFSVDIESIENKGTDNVIKSTIDEGENLILSDYNIDCS